jgi:hypothetical protein
MCLYPKLINNRKYIANKKNGGNIPAVSDKRVLMVPVGCGKCIECKKQKAREWQVRLHEEIRNDNTGRFITFTFSNESIKELTETIKGLSGYELDNEIVTLATRRFLERWRKKYKKSVKHWFVSELGKGKTEHVHIHGILWTKESNETIEQIWKYGNTWISNDKNGGYVNERTINYIVKYVNKIDEHHKEYTSKILVSPGIGKNYINRIDRRNNKFKGNETNETYKTRNGLKIALPIYYRNKIYSEEEKEKLWLAKLDKEERWVCGTKIDISKGEEQYYRELEHYRKINKELGYGDNEKNWERKKYENERRNLKTLERIKKAKN